MAFNSSSKVSPLVTSLPRRSQLSRAPPYLCGRTLPPQPGMSFHSPDILRASGALLPDLGPLPPAAAAPHQAPLLTATDSSSSSGARNSSSSAFATDPLLEPLDYPANRVSGRAGAGDDGNVDWRPRTASRPLSPTDSNDSARCGRGATGSSLLSSRRMEPQNGSHAAHDATGSTEDSGAVSPTQTASSSSEKA